MATAEMNAEGNQADDLLSPSEEDSPPVLNDTSAPLNFSELTPREFGISVKSFTPASLSNGKDKFRLAQIKSRRKSSIGARGSPETNSLIRFMAQQRMKTSSTFQTLELVRSSPFLPRVASTLRQKMASFQSLMDVEESGVCDPMPGQDSNTGGCIKTRDYLSDRNSHHGGKENHPPTMTPMPSKRGRLAPIDGCEVEIREASAPILHEEEEAVKQVVTRGPLPSSELVEEDQAVLITPTLHTDLELHTCSPAMDEQDDLFELESLGRPPPDDCAAAPPAGAASLFHIAAFPSLLAMKPAGEKKKSVRFGGPLSPEFFDKHLPPSTPLKKGGTPGRAATPCGSFQLCSVLKTPQRSEPRTTTTQARLDLSGLDMFGASPTLAMPRNRSVASAGEDDKDSDGGRTIAFPLMEEIDSAETGDTEYTLENQPVNLNAAFHEEFLSQILTESETSPSTISPADSLDEPAPFLEKENHHEAAVEAPVEAPARSRNQRKKHPGPEQAARSEPPAGCAGRKRKLPEESEPVKRSTRSAAKAASGRIKTNSAAKWRWNKDVDRSLYGSRAYASKNPNLSPITERLPLLQSQAAQQIPSPNHETGSNPQSADDPPATDDLPATNALEKLSGDPVTSPNSSKKQPLRKGRRQSGPRVKRNGAKKRRVAVPNEALRGEESLDQTGRSTEELCEEQTTTDPDASSGTPLTRSEPEQGKVDAEHDAVIPAETLGADCPGSGAESDNTLSQSGRRTPRRGSVDAAALRERENRAEAEQGEQAASRQENLQSSSGGQEGTGVADFHLAPWQADFNFEDVFKPVPARLQRSVRRSLRNRSAAEQGVGDGSAGNSSVGLAWLAWTSPDSNKESRRKTRGRRLSAAPAVLPALPEGNAAS
uniref:cell division cycle-associated protein 2 isoform X2 n=1 Tax=Gasterosteus aculeatus aculeatus TaxID=481459 RepID=UPI001A982B2F|nr:cell division cycle-associated protein 2 isoform X2 [Gasterosteus aculeatus aculeatus]